MRGAIELKQNPYMTTSVMILAEVCVCDILLFLLSVTEGL